MLSDNWFITAHDGRLCFDKCLSVNTGEYTNLWCQVPASVPISFLGVGGGNPSSSRGGTPGQVPPWPGQDSGNTPPSPARTGLRYTPSPPGQDRSTFPVGTGDPPPPPPGLVMLRAVCLLRFPVGGLSCLCYMFICI